MNENTGPRIVGHRGAMAHRPENTLESYRYAEELGVAEIELDIRLSADGHVFILHDATIDRVAPVPGSLSGVDVSTLTLEQLRGVDLGEWLGIPTLTEALDATTTSIQIEIKDPRVVPAAAAILNARPQDHGRLQFTSFNHEALVQAKNLCPQIPRGFILGGTTALTEDLDSLFALLEDNGAAFVHLNVDAVRDAAVQELHRRGYLPTLWPLRGPDDVLKALAIGAHAVCADDPAAAKRWITQVMAATTS
ncbi:glycerophosphodiester phosphodiesterase [Glutamicibacter protophormiae]|uniref:glycerophosphodiester phosphodiesterase n=1 Tax=Glutamicibacter protophormiae TaxID=37930 RepID=UPI0019587DC9|nr:glycerophosphodiester phosphodiesterase [Glutamicibacter protophormiae]QRQ77113.1 glycerophosphodiester phosphodiesterase [Glutamicibacter protophormiae]WPR63083.1 glycerophosphodiester phosphodiesterase [Glutamicibacter protophormiae]WPR66580.1 glycerophosphodiester phosphodiesterase [Glutamicibacter protophormiae]